VAPAEWEGTAGLKFGVDWVCHLGSGLRFATYKKICPLRAVVSMYWVWALPVQYNPPLPTITNGAQSDGLSNHNFRSFGVAVKNPFSSEAK